LVCFVQFNFGCLTDNRPTVTEVVGDNCVFVRHLIFTDAHPILESTKNYIPDTTTVLE
jgi:hypothetical protein